MPGFVAAGFRHFKSLRSLRRDYGWIPTLLEEAENERMHLLVCLSQFQAGFITRAFVITLQGVMVPALMAVYLVHPKSLVSGEFAIMLNPLTLFLLTFRGFLCSIDL